MIRESNPESVLCMEFLKPVIAELRKEHRFDRAPVVAVLITLATDLKAEVKEPK